MGPTAEVTAKAPFKVCPSCGRGALRARLASVPLVVDGQRHVVRNVLTWKCTLCRESLLHATEIRKAEETVRQRYSGQFRLRVDPKLHQRLVNVARKHRRSLNQEVVHLIERALESDGEAA